MNPLLIAAPIAAIIAALALTDDRETVQAAKIVVDLLPPLPPAVSTEKPWGTGPLPAQAIAAWNDEDNKLRSAGFGRWFRWAKFSKGTRRKVDKTRFYANPPGAIYFKSYSDTSNLSWMARCPDAWYPKHGHRDQSARVDALDPWLSPKADWKTLTGALADSVKALPAIVESAGVIMKGVSTGGGSVAADPAATVSTVVTALEQALTPIGNTGKSTGKRIDAAEAVWQVLESLYRRQLALANPHAFYEGKFNVGKHYHDEPKTFEDLGKPGGSRPLLFNPERVF